MNTIDSILIIFFTVFYIFGTVGEGMFITLKYSGTSHLR